MKKVFSILFALFLLIGAFANSVDAESKYQVFVDEGLYGSVTKVADVPDGTMLGFSAEGGTENYIVYDQKNPSNVFYRIHSTNEKYYVKGVHISGRYLDEEELLDNLDELVVDQDLYLVASYGVKGEQHSYKVYYYTEDGQNLMTLTGAAEECDTFYAYEGERVLVGARVFEGYEDYIVVRGHWKDSTRDIDEATRGFLGTIREDGTIIEYTYRRILPGETVTYDETVVYEPGTGGGGGGGGGAAPAPVTPETPEIIDIDEPEVPQTEPENPSDNQGNNQGEEIIEPEPVPTTNWWQELVSKPWLLAGSGLALGMLLFFLAFLFKRRKENDQ